MHRTRSLSLIVPIYNVENYIEECLQSIVESMDDSMNLQVILVDDGSQDGSGRIARKYAETYSNFQYFKKDNGGLSEARNYGLEYVQNAYVSFLDSDDWLHKSYFPKIFAALERQPDMVIFDWMDVIRGSKGQLVNGMDFTDAPWTVRASACNKVFKTNLFTEIKFPKGRIYEDVGTMYKILYYAEDYFYIQEPLYLYRKDRKGSILNTVSVRVDDIYSALEDTYEFYSAKDAMTGENRAGLCYQYVKLLCWSNMYKQLQFFKYDLWGFYLKMKETRQLVYKRFPEWKKNDYLIRNATFFESRLGSDYINKLDGIGKSFLSTLLIIIILISKNRRRLVKAN